MVLDGTLGPRKALQGPKYSITHDLGQQTGGNLFHSFSSFNIHRTESATFTGPSSIENIISRVTGGSASNIDGLISSKIHGADFYFINPSGIVFGPHAQLDITGSFHATTADYIKLGKNGRFDATNPANSVLTTAAPSAFGFLSDSPKPIFLEGSGSRLAEDDSGWKGLSVSEGKTMSIIGGDITISSGLLNGIDEVESRLIAPGGRINIASVASPGEIIPTGSGLDADSFSQLGNITISEGSYVAITGQGAGSIYIRGEQFVIDSSNIDPETQIFTGLYANTFGYKDGGVIDISAESLRVTNEGRIYGATFGDGRGANINIKTSEFVMDNDGLIQTATATIAKGDAGIVSIETDSFTLTGGATIDMSSYGAGEGGNLTINASEKVSISGFDSNGYSSGFFSHTSNGGKGGVVSLTTPSLVMDNKGVIVVTASGEGDAGSISIEVDKLTLKGGATINTSSWGAGKGGKLAINASEKVYISGFDSKGIRSGFSSNTYKGGKGGEISISTPSLIMDNEGKITAETFGEGDAGSISIEVDKLALTGGANISTDSDGTGKGGKLTINASEKVAISGFSSNDWSGLFSNAKGSGDGGEISITTPSFVMNKDGLIQAATKAEGDAGNIFIRADKFILRGGALIDTSSVGPGKGGKLTVNASEKVSISGFSSSDSSGLYSNAYKGGKGGEISIYSPSLIMDNEGIIQAKTEDAGTAGHIKINAENIRLTHNVSINTESTGTGKAGDIFINTGDTVKLQNSSITAATDNADGGNIKLRTRYMLESNNSDITATVKGGTGDGGNIDIDPVYLILDKSKIIANAERGRGGNIAITADHFIVSPDSLVSASSRFGVDGNVVIDSPASDISVNLSALPSSLLSTEALSPSHCATREEELSSFIVKGRDGLPPRPDSILASP